METSLIAEMIERNLPGAVVDVDCAASGSIYLDCWVEGGGRRATCRISDHAADASPYHRMRLARTGRAADVEVDPDHHVSGLIAAGILADLLGLPLTTAVKAARTRRARAERIAEEIRRAAVAERVAAAAQKRRRAEATEKNPWGWLAVLAACEAYRRSASLPNKSARKRARQLPALISSIVGGIDQELIFAAARAAE